MNNVEDKIISLKNDIIDAIIAKLKSKYNNCFDSKDFGENIILTVDFDGYADFAAVKYIKATDGNNLIFTFSDTDYSIENYEVTILKNDLYSEISIESLYCVLTLI